MRSLVIFASGKGSNAAAIIDYFKKTGLARVALIVSNKKDAGILDIAKNENIPAIVIDRQSFQDLSLVSQIQSHNPSLIVLAGFLWKIPEGFISAFQGRIINIHPALLPKYGGKGMYGHHVHQAVIAAGEKVSGITIHYVDEAYDSGDTIVQASCTVSADDDADSLAARIHKLEHFYFPRTIEFLLTNQNTTT
ncbi:MAG: phosphoribosylglycinamide formyltransferase [Sphingobacteriales bacterium]|nr:MAG: phosphoribosylglycinamide formyltransferase [Sphingobacteriales bacterium]